MTGWRRFGSIVPVWVVLVLAPMCLGGEEAEAPQYSPEVQKRLDALRAKGEPVTVEDLTPAPIPPEENAATIYLKAFAAFVAPDDDVREIVIRGTWTAEEMPRVRRWVEQNKEALEYLRQACRIEKFQSLEDYRAHFQGPPGPARWGDGDSPPWLLRCTISLSLADGDVERGFQDCLTSVRVARHFGLGPTQADFMREVEFLKPPLASLDRILPRSELAEADYKEAAGVFQEALKTGSVAPMLRGERVLILYLMGMWRGPGSDVPVAPSAKQPGIGDLVDPLTMEILDYYDKVLPLAEKPYSEVASEVRKLDLSVARSNNLFLLDASPRPLVVELQARVRNKLSEALVAVELEVHRRASGSYPDALADLRLKYMSQLPSDPFSGGPFVYRREGEGYVLYSVGPNGNDDGGKRDLKDPEGPDDIVWTVEPGGGEGK